MINFVIIIFSRVLKNREKIVKTPPMPLNHPLKSTNDGKKNRIEQAKLAIGIEFTLFIILKYVY
jgi:hypothetical protein